MYIQDFIYTYIYRTTYKHIQDYINTDIQDYIYTYIYRAENFRM